MKKRILTLALVLMLLTSCLLPCATAFAQEESDATVETPFYMDFITGATPGGSQIVERCPTPSKLEYLERIDGTPFATLKTIDLVLPLTYHLATDGSMIFNLSSLSVSDFLEAMQLSSFGVLQSYVKHFEFKGIVDGAPLFKAIYYETYYLNSKTADGCFKNFYIDCSKSFTEFFDEQKKLSFTNYDKDGNATSSSTNLLTEQDIEVFSNSIYAAYPSQLSKYSLDEIYGYWGFVPVPKSDTFNGFFNEIGGGTFKSANINCFSVQHAIPYQFMKEMQNDYNMSTFYKLLNGIGHLFGANKDWVVWCYMFYVDGGDTELLITQNGSNKLETTQGGLVNEADKLIDSIDWGALFTGPVVAGLLVTALVLVVGIIALKIFKKSKGRKK